MSGLLKVPLFHDEIVPSFLFRTAVANGRTRLRPFCRDLGLNYEALMRGELDATRHAERVLGFPAGVLCDRRAVVVRPGVVEFGGERFVAGAMEFTSSRFCPRCFVIDDADEGRKPGVRRYLRTAWMLEAVPVCTRHGCRLVDLPECERPRAAFETYRAIEGSGLSGMIQRVEPTEFECFVTDRVGRMARGTDRADCSLAECIELCLPLGLAATFGPVFGFRSLDHDEIRAMRQAGFEVFKRGEVGFNELLDGLLSRAKSDCARRKYDLYGDIRDFLDSRCNEFHSYRRQMHAHALLRNPETFPVRRNRRCIGEGMSASEIAVASGTGIESVLSYLRFHALIPAETVPGDKVVVDRDIGEASVAALSQATTEAEAAGLLGCSSTDLRSLVISGLVTPLMWGGSPAELGQNDRYHRDHLNAFRLRFEPSAAVGGDGLSTVETAVRQLGCEIGDVLKCVLDGRINAFSAEGIRTPLIGLRLSVWEAIEALGLVGMVGARDARRRLGLDQASFKVAAGNGLIAAELDDLGNPVNLHLTDIHRFERRYVTLPPMARALGLREPYLARIFSTYGIRPAFPPLALKTPIFHRGDVARRLAAKRKEQEGSLSGIVSIRRCVAVRSHLARRRFPPAGLSARLSGRTRRPDHLSCRASNRSA